jgi:hypothetical protein
MVVVWRPRRYLILVYLVAATMAFVIAMGSYIFLIQYFL